MLPPPLRLNALLPEVDWLPKELRPEDVEGVVLAVERAEVLPAEGREPMLPLLGRDPTFPVEGREPTFPVDGLAPPELQPRASRVLGLAPLCRSRF